MVNSLITNLLIHNALLSIHMRRPSALRMSIEVIYFRAHVYMNAYLYNAGVTSRRSEKLSLGDFILSFCYISHTRREHIRDFCKERERESLFSRAEGHYTRPVLLGACPVSAVMGARVRATECSKKEERRKKK